MCNEVLLVVVFSSTVGLVTNKLAIFEANRLSSSPHTTSSHRAVLMRILPPVNVFLHANLGCACTITLFIDPPLPEIHILRSVNLNPSKPLKPLDFSGTMTSWPARLTPRL